MMKKFESLSDLAKANITWIIAVVLAIGGLVLDSRYETKVDAKIEENRIDSLEKKMNDFILSYQLKEAFHEGEITTINRRLTNKIDIQNNTILDVDDNENILIEHGAQMDLMIELFKDVIKDKDKK